MTLGTYWRAIHLPYLTKQSRFVLYTSLRSHCRHRRYGFISMLEASGALQ